MTNAITFIRNMGVLIDELPTCKIAADGGLLMEVEKYNEIVNMLNDYNSGKTLIEKDYD